MESIGTIDLGFFFFFFLFFLVLALGLGLVGQFHCLLEMGTSGGVYHKN